MNVKNIRKKLQGFVKHEKHETGFLGRADGTVRVPGKLHWVYVRLWNGDVIEAFNNGDVPPAFGLAVEVEYRGSRYYLAPRDSYEQPVFVGLPDGAEDELQWPGLHTLYVRPEQFLPGLVIPKSGLTVIVHGGSLPLAGGGYLIVPTQEIDLTPYVPASNAIWVTLGWSNSGTVLIQTGGAANSIGELSTSNIPATGGFDLAAIKMFNGQTSISHGKFGSVIVDLRFFKFSPIGGGSISLPANRIIATDGSGDVATNAPTWSSDGLASWSEVPFTFPPSSTLGLYLAAETLTPGASFIKASSDAVGGGVNFVKYGGLLSSPSAVQSGWRLGSFSFGGHYGTGVDAVKARIAAVATQNWTDVNRGAKIVVSATPDNSTIMDDVAEFTGDRIDFLKAAFAPTATSGTNTTQIATTAFVRGEINNTRFLLPFSSYSALGGPISGATAYPYAVTLPSYTIYLKQWSQSVYTSTANDSSNYWIIDLLTVISGSPTVIATVDTIGLTIGTTVKVATSFSVSALTQAANRNLVIRVTRVGSPSSPIFLHGPAVEYTLS